MPVNMLIVRALLQYYLYYGPSFTIEMSDGIRQADEPLRGGRGDRRRLSGIFLKDEQGKRPVHGPALKFQGDPH